MKIVSGQKKIKNPKIEDIKTTADLPKDGRSCKKLGPLEYLYRGQVLKFKENGELRKDSGLIENPELEVVKNKGGRPRLDKVAVRNGVIDLSWKQLQKVLKDPKYDDKVKVMIALRMAEKTIPQQVDITSGGVPLILPPEIINKNGLDG